MTRIIKKKKGMAPTPAGSPTQGPTVVSEIQRAIRRGYGRLFVIGPKGSKRLSSVIQALRAINYRTVIVDVGSVRLRRQLEAAVKSSTRESDFYSGMKKLERQARKHRTAVVFHDFDGCSGSPGEDLIVYEVLMQLHEHFPSLLVVMTARDPKFCDACLERFSSCRTYVRKIAMPAPTQKGDGSSRDLEKTIR